MGAMGTGGQEEDDGRACGALIVIPTALGTSPTGQSHRQPCGTLARQPHQLCDWQRRPALGQAVHVLGPQRGQDVASALEGGDTGNTEGRERRSTRGPGS